MQAEKNALPDNPLDDEIGIIEQYRSNCSDNFFSFASGLIIPSAQGPRQFSKCIQPFQIETFKSLAPSLHAVRDGTMPPCRRFWIERTKKAGKDSDLAICLLWLMAYSTRPVKGQVCASHSKQARIIEDRAIEILRYNPWLNDRVEIVQSLIRNKQIPREIWVRIEATDSTGGAHGQTPDILILNELVHVSRWKAMEDHMNNADGVPQGIVIVSTNAGIRGTKAYLWREEALANKQRWKSHIWNTKAPWLSDEDVEAARLRDPVGSEWTRLWKGEWIDGTGNAIDSKSIDRCFDNELQPLVGPEKKWIYIAGLDLGITHDHSGLVVLGVNIQEQKIRLAWMRGWAPSKVTGEVDLTEVEETCYNIHRTFGLTWLGYDPYEARLLAQRLTKKGVPMAEMSFSPKNLTAMAQSFVQVMEAGKLECYDDTDGRLRRDFGKFNIVHKPPSGYKLESVSDEYGHADVGTALVICLPYAVQLLGGGNWLTPDDSLWEDIDEPITKEEIDEMPDELRDIYEDAKLMNEEDKGRKLGFDDF